MGTPSDMRVVMLSARTSKATIPASITLRLHPFTCIETDPWDLSVLGAAQSMPFDIASHL